jgi:glycerol kinase
VTVADLTLAVDQGSSSSRCVVLDGELRPLASASRPLASAFPCPGRVEHDPDELVDTVLASMARALALAGAAWQDVACIGLAAQTETFVVWDRGTGRPVYPAISWRDTRAADACGRLRADGREAEIRARTGLPAQSAFSAPKLGWLLAEVPGAARAAARGRLAFGDVNSWLIWRLTGGSAHITEPSMASRSMLFSLPAGDWDPAMIELFGIERSLLPVIGPTVGELAVTDARVCGGQAAITASVGDQQAALFGQRCWQEGAVKLTLGTGAFLWCHAGHRPPAPVPHGVVASCAWQLAGATAYALEGFVPNAGGVTTWLRQLGVIGPQAWPLIRPGAMAAAADGTWCVPALFGLGTPHWNPAAGAQIGGLVAASTGPDLAEAALIGVAHQVVDAIEAVQSGLTSPVRMLRVDGGLGRNDSVLQAIADLSGLSLERPAGTEVTAWGAGALAALGAGRYDLAALAGLPFEAGQRVRPALAATARAAARSRWNERLAGWQAGEAARRGHDGQAAERAGSGS